MKKLLSVAIFACALSCSRVESKIGDLHSSDVNKRGNATRALAELGDKRAVDPLIDVLEHDADLYVRRDAAEALGKLGDARAIAPLCRALGDRDYPVVAPAAAKALASFGGAAFEPVLAQFRSGDKPHRYGAAIALGEIGDKRAIAPLLEYKTSDFQESQAISEALAKLRDPREIVAELVAALEDADTMVRTRAARGLGALGETANQADIANALARHLNDPDDGAAAASASALMAIGSEGRKQSIAALQSPDANVRLRAITPLDFRASSMLLHPIINALHDSDPRVRAAAAHSLWGFTDGEAVDALLAALNDPAAEESAAASLVKIEDPRVTDALMTRLHQRKLGVVASAMPFYLRQGEAGSESILIDALNAHGGQSMAELFLNCGNPKLHDAAQAWAKRYGFEIREQVPGSTSGGPRWGAR